MPQSSQKGCSLTTHNVTNNVILDLDKNKNIGRSVDLANHDRKEMQGFVYPIPFPTLISETKGDFSLAE